MSRSSASRLRCGRHRNASPSAKSAKHSCSRRCRSFVSPLSVDSPDANLAHSRRRSSSSAGQAVQPHYPAAPWPDVAPPRTPAPLSLRISRTMARARPIRRADTALAHQGRGRREIGIGTGSTLRRLYGTPGPRACKFCWLTIRPRKWSEFGAGNHWIDLRV